MIVTCGFRAWLHTDESGNGETSSFKLLYNGTVVGMGDAQRLMFSTNFMFDPLRRPSSFNFTATYKDQKDCNSQAASESVRIPSGYAVLSDQGCRWGY
ncbi:unnamed protein product [Aspergillus oryzae]|nr:unnamed protein product [Aspergillus oryzae]GMF88259.1 unnamed protein product [Aspergillus oryzae]